MPSFGLFLTNFLLSSDFGLGDSSPHVGTGRGDLKVTSDGCSRRDSAPVAAGAWEEIEDLEPSASFGAFCVVQQQPPTLTVGFGHRYGIPGWCGELWMAPGRRIYDAQRGVLDEYFGRLW